MPGFGTFDAICAQAALPLCSLVGTSPIEPSLPGIPATCYSRSISLANTIIFSGATGVIHIIALIMTVIMILHVRSKFTAVGRKEITSFFYLYILLTVLSLVLDCGVVPPGSSAKPWFVAAQVGVASATCMCLLINGFVGFQLYEDGTALSLWLLRGVSFIWAGITALVAILTFKSAGGLDPTKTVSLYVVMYILNALFLFIYIVMQLLLVTNTLQDRWPLGHIFFGIFFFVIGQVILYALGSTICVGAQHYFDGIFFATIANLLAVMMIYKFWDSITTEDLEFSVGAKTGNWDVKTPAWGQQGEEEYHDDANASTVASVSGAGVGKDRFLGVASQPPMIRHSFVDNL